MRELRRGVPFSSMSIRTHAIGFSLGRINAGSFLFFIRTESFGQAYAIQRSRTRTPPTDSSRTNEMSRTFFFFLIRRSFARLSCSLVCRQLREAEVEAAIVSMSRSSNQEILPL